MRYNDVALVGKGYDAWVPAQFVPLRAVPDIEAAEVV